MQGSLSGNPAVDAAFSCILTDTILLKYDDLSVFGSEDNILHD